MRRQTPSGGGTGQLLVMVFGFLVCAVGGAAADSPPGPKAGECSIEVGLFGLGARHAEQRPGAMEWILGEIDAFRSNHRSTEVELLNPEDRRDIRPIEDCPTLPKNVLGVCTEPGYEMAYLVERHEIVPIDKFLPDAEFSKDSFYACLWKPVTINGKTWGVPIATTVGVLGYDVKAFEKAGIAAPPRTWEEYIDDAKRLTVDTDGDGQIDQLGSYRLPAKAVPYLARLILAQRGIPLISPDGFLAYSPEIGDAIALARRVVESTTKVPSSVVPSPKIAMFVTFTRGKDLTELPDKHDYRLVDPPTCGSESQVDFDTVYLAIRRSTPEQEAASWALVKWLTRRDTALPKGIGGYPARKDLVEREDFRTAAAASYQNLQVLWSRNAQLTQSESSATVGGGAGLRALFAAVEYGAITGTAAESAWNATVDELNKKAKAIRTDGEDSYGLFK